MRMERGERLKDVEEERRETCGKMGKRRAVGLLPTTQ